MNDFLFAAKTIFKPLEGKEFCYFEELDNALTQLWKNHMEILPSGYGSKRLFEYADRMGWVKYTKNGIRFILE